MELTLTSREREFLVQILEERQRELLREIARAAHHQVRAELKSSEELLESIIRRLGTAPTRENAVA